MKNSYKRIPAVVIVAFAFGSNAVPAQAQPPPSVEGQWGPVLSFPNQQTHAHVLPTGRVLFWHSTGGGYSLWNPTTGYFNPYVPTLEANLFCSGHAFLPDGRLLVAGGSRGSQRGAPEAGIYDPAMNAWTRLPDMNAGRWYPSNLTLANGDVLVLSGWNELGAQNVLPQVWQGAAGTWRDLTTAKLKLKLYPRLSLAPDGRAYVSGHDKTTRYLDTTGTGSWETGPKLKGNSRGNGSYVMYEPGKILAVGGGDKPQATAEVIDLNLATPAWSFVAPMSIARRHLNATLLPNGQVLVTGGTRKPGDDSAGKVLYGEIWHPAANTWTRTAPYVTYRGYHSTAELLPDGRVLSGGGNGMNNAEVYSPPYLFKEGARPTISSAPKSVTYGQTFEVTTADAASIGMVTWVRLSSVTHSINMNQRINFLTFHPEGGGVRVTAPSDRNLCPPGHYILFILNDEGVPAEGKIIQIT